MPQPFSVNYRLGPIFAPHLGSVTEDWNLLSHRKYCTILFFILIDQSIIYSYSSTHVYFSVCLNTCMFVCIANDSIYDLWKLLLLYYLVHVELLVNHKYVYLL